MDLSSILSALPDNVQGYAALVVIICNLLTVFIRPPAAGSRWVIPYQIISTLALNLGWATNRLQAGHAGTTGPASANAASTPTNKARDSPGH